MKKIVLARAGYPYLFTTLILGAVSLAVFWPRPLPSLFFFGLALFFTFFFRDPLRHPPAVRGSIVSPADGRIQKIQITYEPDFIGAEAWKISIFLSLLDVHINRSPYGGLIEYLKYIPGKYKAAYRQDVSRHNERNLIGLQTEHGKMLVVQVAVYGSPYNPPTQHR